MIKTLRLDRFQRQGLGWPAAGRVGRRTSLSALNVRPPGSELLHFTEVLQEYSELSCLGGRQVLYYRGSDGLGGPARSAGMSNEQRPKAQQLRSNNNMSQRVAAIMGRRDGRVLAQNGMHVLTGKRETLRPTLNSLGFKNEEIDELRWMPYAEGSDAIWWWRWENKASMCIAEGGCCLELSIRWHSFLNHVEIYDKCVELIKLIGICFSADMAIISPDTSELHNLSLEKMQGGTSFAYIVSNVDAKKWIVWSNPRGNRPRKFGLLFATREDPDAIIEQW